MPVNLDDVKAAILSNDPLKIANAFDAAKTEKHWKAIKLFCDLEDSDPRKPIDAQKEKLINEARSAALAGEPERWEDVFNLERVFSAPHELKAGPFPRTSYTIELEAFVRELMTKEGENFSITHPDGDDVFTFEATGNRYNWSQLVRHANFQHLLLNQKDFDRYRDYSQNESLSYPFDLDFFPKLEGRNQVDTYLKKLYFSYDSKGIPRPTPLISYEEMQAINIYTGEGFKVINPLLRGEIHGTNWVHPDYQCTISDDVLRAAIINAVFCCSGLGKLPDVVASDAYRGKGSAADDLEFHIKTAARKGVISCGGFLSASLSDARAAYYAKEFGMVLHYTHLRGVNVSPISEYPSEDEFLIPPTDVQMTGYHYYKDYKGFGPTYVIEVSVVSDLGFVESFFPERLKSIPSLSLHGAESMQKIDGPKQQERRNQSILDKYGLFSSDKCQKKPTDMDIVEKGASIL